MEDFKDWVRYGAEREIEGRERERREARAFQEYHSPVSTSCQTITTVGSGKSKSWPLSLGMKPSPFICSSFLVFYLFPTWH